MPQAHPELPARHPRHPPPTRTMHATVDAFAGHWLSTTANWRQRQGNRMQERSNSAPPSSQMSPWAAQTRKAKVDSWPPAERDPCGEKATQGVPPTCTSADRQWQRLPCT
eukprot:14564978-Alexandrium_andersonii.AAC.1